MEAARFILSLPPECFAFGDALMRVAFIAGARGE